MTIKQLLLSAAVIGLATSNALATEPKVFNKGSNTKIGGYKVWEYFFYNGSFPPRIGRTKVFHLTKNQQFIETSTFEDIKHEHKINHPEAASRLTTFFREIDNGNAISCPNIDTNLTNDDTLVPVDAVVIGTRDLANCTKLAKEFSKIAAPYNSVHD